MKSLADWCKENNMEYLLDDWDYELNQVEPSEVSYGSITRIWWKCSKGHSYSTTANNKTSHKAQCPFCFGKKVLRGFNDFATLCPELAAEWDYEKNSLSPYSISKASNKNIWWICNRGHSYQSSIGNRRKGEGCPYCSNKKILSGYNDFETWCYQHNQTTLLAEWDDSNNNVLPSQVSIYYPQRINWICSLCGKTFKTTVAVRTRLESEEYKEKYGRRTIAGCPTCTSRMAHEKVVDSLVQQKGSLKSNNPQLAMEWDWEKNGSLSPEKLTEWSNIKVWWKCPLGHSYKTGINNRSSGRGCPFCAGKKVLQGFNDLSTTNPELVEEWDFEKNHITPDMVSSGSEKKVWWKCKVCGNSWRAVIYSRLSTGCPRCSKELRTSFPEQAVFYYVSKLYPDAINGDRHLGKEFDIYIPSKRIAIEYDGYKWHSDVQRDIDKDLLCKKNGITLYRIRENGCPILPHSKNVTTFQIREGNRGDLTKVIRRICCQLSEQIDYEIDVENDEGAIYEQYITGVRKNSFAQKHPDLLQYWDYEKNKDIKPEYVTEKTNKRVWWFCEKGHSYKQSVNSKTSGIGCPICSNRKVLQGYNDLQTVNPDLAAEWNYERNGGLKPSDVAIHSRVKVWWLGKCGHEWKAGVDTRSYGTGCPYCCNPPKKVLRGFNDLQSQYPLVAAEWDDKRNKLAAFEVFSQSNKRVWWICPKGHSYQLPVYRRVGGQGCRICSNRIIEKGINDLGTTNTNLIHDWIFEKNDTSPYEVGPGSTVKVWWRCQKGHEWEATINSRVHGTGCPICANKKVITGDNDLLSTNPDVVNIWDFEKNGELNPRDVSAGSNGKVWWKCDKNHSWLASIDAVAKRKHGCPVCANKKVVEGYNDIVTTNPELLLEWDYEKNKLSPTELSYGSTKKIWWKCSKGHSYSTTVNAKVSNHAGCPYCSSQALLKGFNDLATCYPDIAKEWDSDKNTIGPEDVQPFSHIKAWWKCEKGHEWESTISGRVNSGCPFCSNRRVLAGYNDIATTDPDLLEEWDYEKNQIKPSEVSSGMNKKIWWKCKQGHSYQTVLYSRKAGRGCPICGRISAGRKKEKPVVLIEKNKVFSSLNEAAQYCNLTPGTISACCKGKNKTAGGFHWRFYGE